MSQKVMLRFEIIEDGAVTRTEELDQNVIKIGKLPSSHLRLDDPNVSRIHAVIERGSDGGYSVIDLGSASGTFVNGDKVTKAAIDSGDELRFGDTTIRVEMVEAAQRATAEDFGAGEATVVTEGVADAAASDQPAGAAAGPGAEAQPAAGGQITLEDGSVVEPYTMAGYYDDQGNYFPGYYDAQGQYHLGYGYTNDAGQWEVANGYYDPAGEWIATDQPVGSIADVSGDGYSQAAEAAYAARRQGPSATELYEGDFFESSGGDTLEVAMLWSDQVLAVQSYPEPKTVQIGPERDNDFIVEDPSFQGTHFPLVSHEGGWALGVTERMGGFVQNGDKVYTIAEAIEAGVAKPSHAGPGSYQVPLGPQTQARVEVGPTTFLVHFTDVPAVIGGGVSFDTAPVPYVALSAIAHLAFLFIALTIPEDAGNLDLDGFQADDRFVQMMVKPEQKEEEKPDWLDEGGDEEEAAKHKGEEGKAGKEDEVVEDKRMAIKGPPDNQDLELKKARDTEAAMNAGVMQVFQQQQVSSMWGNSTNSVGSDAIHALGNLQGDSVGNAKGFGGLGLSGAGRGGGGVSERGIGLANVGTAGRGGGGRGGSGYGRGAADLGEKKTAMPKVIPGRPVVTGSLDKEIIRRVIRQHRREIKYCYEQQLQKNKNLAGQVKVKFTISATGDVISALVSSSSLKSPPVEQCMLGKIRRWVFPEPKGGGIVIVNYPFNFSR